MSRIRLANVIFKFICENTNLPMAALFRSPGYDAELRRKRTWALLALALALSITALPPPSRADVGQPDHYNASAAGLQLEAPLNELSRNSVVEDDERLEYLVSGRITALAEACDEADAAAVCADQGQGQW
ncbi:hypothetical protein EMIHUDRAFT_211253 [Emiliania huxleyi CCMP1516]|uniref:UrcA family protein n=2 Tax=Emiliania huxleyi TaxID=2903 RepID=A0A0D3IWP7_EMIH1|nr:hypothetical protein EMIHUDRAFT_211253 [Emiliania huxleyi CCMP1516]EOD15682.1 hypothetical protein EMIHUDRAFT_211253 [Emiliania huxleyi CCMP1516]|eukprot:XP_005768111.1 hypothetical protein EMIHUDRAFT_211253 [Emiliania huxleyi CCMP1516]